MPLSASTLIHFTSSKEALRSILIENFRVFYCRETIVFSKKPITFHVPMVSFCDIPLSEIKSHISKYGRYGIGLTKEWGRKNGLNPVLYMSTDSHVSKNFTKAFIKFADRRKEESQEWTEEQKPLVDLIRYMKNYEGDLVRKSSTTKNYRFSDEREWRFVPPVDSECELILGQKTHADAASRAEVEATAEAIRLEFEPNDIKYIIIQNDSEIGEFIDHLRRAKGSKYTLEDVERLTTRILTAEQIENDI